MASYEYSIFIGNVGKTEDLKYTKSGVAVFSFSLAVNRSWTDKASGEKREETKWIRVTCWRGLAETCNEYVRKGAQIMVAGDVSASAYLDKDGQPRASLELTARDVQFLGRKGDAPETSTDESEEYPF